jgi:hypothetical protein
VRFLTYVTTSSVAVLVANPATYAAALGSELARDRVALAGCASYRRRVEQERVYELGAAAGRFLECKGKG